jgi:hypothetical protein
MAAAADKFGAWLPMAIFKSGGTTKPGFPLRSAATGIGFGAGAAEAAFPLLRAEAFGGLLRVLGRILDGE